MIVGSGLLANAFRSRFDGDADAWVYAAGVSNSSCSDPKEYEREHARLAEALAAAAGARAFVYFSTCSIGDPAAAASFYVRHKIEMEAFVARHPGHLVARLPQVVGHTPNPHTLLNYLYARISRSEKFEAWKNAYRNVIDVTDVAAAVTYAIDRSLHRGETVNVASPVSVPVSAIVAALETVVGKPAVVQWRDTGVPYPIDVSAMMPIYDALGLPFGDEYLLHVIQKYYG